MKGKNRELTIEELEILVFRSEKLPKKVVLTPRSTLALKKCGITIKDLLLPKKPLDGDGDGHRHYNEHFQKALLLQNYFEVKKARSEISKMKKRKRSSSQVGMTHEMKTNEIRLFKNFLGKQKSELKNIIYLAQLEDLRNRKMEKYKLRNKKREIMLRREKENLKMKNYQKKKLNEKRRLKILKKKEKKVKDFIKKRRLKEEYVKKIKEERKKESENAKLKRTRSDLILNLKRKRAYDTSKLIEEERKIMGENRIAIKSVKSKKFVRRIKSKKNENVKFRKKVFYDRQLEIMRRQEERKREKERKFMKKQMEAARKLSESKLEKEHQRYLMKVKSMQKMKKVKEIKEKQKVIDEQKKKSLEMKDLKIKKRIESKLRTNELRMSQKIDGDFQKSIKRENKLKKILNMKKQKEYFKYLQMKRKELILLKRQQDREKTKQLGIKEKKLDSIEKHNRLEKNRRKLEYKRDIKIQEIKEKKERIEEQTKSKRKLRTSKKKMRDLLELEKLRIKKMVGKMKNDGSFSMKNVKKALKGSSLNVNVEKMDLLREERRKRKKAIMERRKQKKKKSLKRSNSAYIRRRVRDSFMIEKKTKKVKKKVFTKPKKRKFVNAKKRKKKKRNNFVFSNPRLYNIAYNRKSLQFSDKFGKSRLRLLNEDYKDRDVSQYRKINYRYDRDGAKLKVKERKQKLQEELYDMLLEEKEKEGILLTEIKQTEDIDKRKELRKVLKEMRSIANENILEFASENELQIERKMLFS